MTSIDTFILCEDIRTEARGQWTLVGVFGHALSVPVLPVRFPKLAAFIRVNGLDPGKYPCSLQLRDEAAEEDLLTASVEHVQPEKDIVAPATFQFQFGGVRVRSWGNFVAHFKLGDALSASQTMVLRPPSWDMVFVRCQHCQSLFPSPVSARPGAQVSLSANRIQCPNCRNMTLFDDKTAVRLQPPSFTLDQP